MAIEQADSSGDDSLTEAAIKSLVNSEKSVNRMILIGAPDWVKGIIQLLHAARITEVKDWSRLIKTHNPNEVISLMQRPKTEK